MKQLNLKNILLSVALSVFAAGAFAADKPLLEDVHKDLGLACKDCHATKPYKEPPVTACFECHDTKELAETTKEHPITNPHENRHFGTETNCNYCHHQHKESENYCGSCHLRFKLVTP